MKTQRLLISCFVLICCCTALWADVEINETNFPDEKFRNWLLEQPYGIDGVLKKKEIAEVKEINVINLGIQSLKGIEFFKALEKLYCRNNQIKGADMDALIKKLPSINLNKEAEIKGFNIASNTPESVVAEVFGRRLYAIGSENEQNVMTAKQVATAKAKGWTPYASDGFNWYKYPGANSKKAKGIEISEENFPDINFRKCLFSFDIDADSVLTDAEIKAVIFVKVEKRNIQSLKGIEYFKYLKHLFCSGNQLSVLDLSKNTKLEILVCSSNRLSTLDTSKNTALIELLCDNNQLTELDVSNCITLTKLHCYANQLTTLDVSNSKNLTSLYCHQNMIKDAGMDKLVNSLPAGNNRKMSVLYYTQEQNAISSSQVEAAKAKGWIPYYSDGNNWQEYTSSKE